jgi:teichuronic acid biosynthesis glycosyltransferase TuaG
VIPTYQRWEATVRAVESVLNQTSQISEIVVVDDGSEDSELELLEEALDKRPVRVIRSKRVSNPGICRQIGLETLTTKWVAFLDSDDFWMPNKIQRQLDELEQHNLLACATNATRLLANGDKEQFSISLPKVLKLHKLRKKNIIINSSVVIDRELLLKFGGISTSYSVRGSEDYATWLRIAESTNWLIIDEELVVYDDTNPASSIRNQRVWPNYYSDVLAHLDYLSWKRSRGNNPVIPRILLELLRRWS